MMSSWTPFPELAKQAKIYREALNETPPKWRQNRARGHVDVARWVYVAETDAKAKKESEEGIMKNLAHFSSGHTSGYLGTVSKDVGANPRDYDALNKDILLHGSPATRDREDRDVARDGGRGFGDAALSALLRAGKGAGLAGAVRDRGDPEVQIAGAEAEDGVGHDCFAQNYPRLTTRFNIARSRSRRREKAAPNMGPLFLSRKRSD